MFVFGLSAVALVHPTLKGQNVRDLADSDGKKFVQAMLEAVKVRNNGWEDYRWQNPVTSQVEGKSVYFERLDHIIVACGIYKGTDRRVSEPHSATTTGKLPRIAAGSSTPPPPKLRSVRVGSVRCQGVTKRHYQFK